MENRKMQSRKLRKIIVLVLFLCVMCLVACGTNTEEKKKKAEDHNQVAAEVLYYSDNNGNGPNHFRIDDVSKTICFLNKNYPEIYHYTYEGSLADGIIASLDSIEGYYSQYSIDTILEYDSDIEKYLEIKVYKGEKDISKELLLSFCFGENKSFVSTGGILFNTYYDEFHEEIIDLDEYEQQMSSIGRIVEFGSYEQNLIGYVEPIKWIVLDEKDGNVLLLSMYALDSTQYDDAHNNWEKSELREWLNSEFYETAFSTKEKKQIVKTKVRTLSSDEKEYFLNERIYVISTDELKEYFPLEEQRKCVETKYCLEHCPTSSKTSNLCLWQTRSESIHDEVFVVDSDGTLRSVWNKSNGPERPMMWVKKSALE